MPFADQADSLDFVPKMMQICVDFIAAGQTPASEMMVYAIQLVGEQHYQAAARSCRPGDVAQLLFEPDNPYDSDAIVAVNGDGETLGYVPRDCWMREAALGEGKGFDAAIKSAAAGKRGFIEIVLDVSRREDPLGERAYVPA